MPYVYERFAGLSFALYDSSAPDTTGRWDAPTFRLSSGGAASGIDTATRGRRDAYDLTLSGDLLGDSLLDVNTQYNALKARARTHGRLVRRGLATNLEMWANAWLLEVVGTERADGGLILPVTLDFRVVSPAWYTVHHSGDTLTWNSGVLWNAGRAWSEASGDVTTLASLSGTPQDVVATNEGTIEVTAVVITITAGSSAITSIRITGNGTDLTWTGMLVAGTTLVLDGTTESVTNNGANAYGGLTWNAGHTIDDLFSLAAGATTYHITGAGGGTGTTVTLVYDAAYA